jgi:hypothetical protein
MLDSTPPGNKLHAAARRYLDRREP